MSPSCTNDPEDKGVWMCPYCKPDPHDQGCYRLEDGEDGFPVEVPCGPPCNRAGFHAATPAGLAEHIQSVHSWDGVSMIDEPHRYLDDPLPRPNVPFPTPPGPTSADKKRARKKKRQKAKRARANGD